MFPAASRVLNSWAEKVLIRLNYLPGGVDNHLLRQVGIDGELLGADEARGPQVPSIGRGVGLVVAGQPDIDEVGPVALHAVAQGLDPVDVDHSGLGGGGVGVGGGRGLGVGHQGRQGALALVGPAPQDLVAVDAVGLLRRGGPRQSHLVLHKARREARGPKSPASGAGSGW